MHILKRITAVLFITITAWYSLYVLRPPEPIPASAPRAVFSAERAFEHVEEIGDMTHPLGTETNERVRAYLVKELHSLGVQPTVKEGLLSLSGIGVVAYVHNIFAKVPGRNPQKTILLMAHYDSAPNAHGAADDGAGVAAILEVIRALKAHEQLKNNVWVLFTGGEERGLLGAQYFIKNNLKWKQVDLVLNVEARGSGGASIMFETSGQNAALISHFEKAAANPVANSLTYTIYKLLPNDTDFSVMKNAGLRGLNFAFIKDYLNYHTWQDNVENLSLASLQHHGSNLLSSVRYFASHNFNVKSSFDTVYFNGPIGGLIIYSAAWSLPISIITAIIFIAFLIAGFIRDKLSLGKYLLGFLSFVLIIALSALITYAGWSLMEALHPVYKWLAQGEVYVHEWYLWGFSALILAVSTAFLHWLYFKLGRHNLMSAIFTFWFILSILSGWFLPTASYLFIWPVLFAAAGWIIASPAFEYQNWIALFIICICLIPAIFIVFPYVPLIQTAMTTEMLWICMLLLTMLIGLCWPLLDLITRKYIFYTSTALAVFFIVAMIGASINSGFDAEHKKQNSLIYAVDLARQKAWWLSSDPEVDVWTSQFLGQNPEVGSPLPIKLYFSYRFLKAQAPFRAIKRARVSLIADRTADSLRYITLRVQSRVEALRMRFSTAYKIDFVKVFFRGQQLFDRTKPFPDQRPRLHRFYYFADLNNPVTFTVAVPTGRDSLYFDLLFTSKKLFDKIINERESRLAYMMPTPFYLSDVVVWKQRVNIAELK